MSNQTRQPAGAPTGGQFAATAHPEAAVALNPTDTHTHEQLLEHLAAIVKGAGAGDKAAVTALARIRRALTDAGYAAGTGPEEMSSMKTTTLAALVLAAGLALTGCTNMPDVTATSTPSVTVTDLAVSQREFPLPDGTFVMLDLHEPLPAGVQDVLNAQATAAIGYVPNSGNTQATQDQPYNDATAFRSATVAATGKNVIVVYRLQGREGCNGSGSDPWTYTEAAGDCVAFPSAAAAQAQAEADVAVRDNADTYIVVVKQG